MSNILCHAILKHYSEEEKMKNLKRTNLIIAFLLVVSLILPSTSFAYPPQLNQLNYVALGDSLAAGYTPYKTVGEGYPEFIRDAVYQLGYDITLNKSYAVGGYKTGDVLTDLQRTDIAIQADVAGADIITISAGANDLLSELVISPTGVSIDPIKVPAIIQNVGVNLSATISLIKALNPDAPIYLMGYYNAMPYIPAAQQDQLLPILTQINATIEIVAAQTGSVYVPTYDTIATNYPEYLPNPQDVHLSTKGYQAVADEFLKVIIPNLPELQKMSSRISGSDRYETAAAIANYGWAKSDTVIIARGDNFADGLSGTPLAYKLDAPILLTKTDTLSLPTREEIARLDAKNAIILGGDAAINENVFNQLEALGLTVRRIAGKNRYETATKIATEVSISPSTALLINSNSYADALTTASYAALNGYPILFTETNQLPSETSNALDSINNVIVIGGTKVISKELFDAIPNATRLGGANRFDTAVKVINHFGAEGHAIYIANGYGFADALTGSVLAAKHGSPLLLIEPSNIPDEIKNYLSNKIFTQFNFLGGTNAIDDSVLENILK
jgi:putative cell wall-binding protein/lysophospholipase L1-like esterase